MIPEIKTPRDKLIETLNAMDERQHNLSFIAILIAHINRYPSDFDAGHLLSIITRLQNVAMSKVADLELIADVAEERATYLNKYLEGTLYTSEEAAREHLPIQITHTQDILNTCKRRWER